MSSNVKQLWMCLGQSLIELHRCVAGVQDQYTLGQQGRPTRFIFHFSSQQNSNGAILCLEAVQGFFSLLGILPVLQNHLSGTIENLGWNSWNCYNKINGRHFENSGNPWKGVGIFLGNRMNATVRPHRYQRLRRDIAPQRSQVQHTVVVAWPSVTTS